MEIRVECDGVPGGDLVPQVVWFGARRVPVGGVVDRWYGAQQRWWKIETDEGLYILRRDEASGLWELAAVTRS